MQCDSSAFLGRLSERDCLKLGVRTSRGLLYLSTLTAGGHTRKLSVDFELVHSNWSVLGQFLEVAPVSIIG